ncbi:beta-ketoacyl synthase [Microseira wollei NIES-4236]|uniref:Beta-ketoacyl synthase n=1 Tax=Microseira wollei NIES-4236 TaxID=2530354 RepID=A0AAV3XTF8_9CYAN|nr:beta-ketoacyl synthase [Microseira wollei NIES-4236]
MALEQLLNQSASQVGVMPINWSQLIATSALTSPFFANFTQLGVKNKEPQAEFRARLEAANVNERRQLLINHIRSEVGKVIGWDVSQTIDLQQGFFELGMDSLTSVELRNSLQKSLGCFLPSSLTFTYPTVTKLVDYLAKEVLLLDSGVELNGESPTTDQEKVPTNSYVEDLSDSEAEALLLQKLESINY